MEKAKSLTALLVVLLLFFVFTNSAFAQEKKKEDSKSSQINGLRTTSITTQAINTTGCSTASSLGSLSCGTTKSGSGSLASEATKWHKVYASNTGTLTVNLSGPSPADFDLYVYSSCSSSWICRPYTGSSNESCTINATAGNYYYIGINSYSGSGSYSINTSLSCSGGTTCNSSSYTSCSSAASMSNGSTKSNMCGSQQFYKISTSTPCTVTWAMTPQSTADFDLYVRNSSGSCPSTSSYDCRPYYGTGSQETCSASLSAGTYYALVNKYGGTGSYNIQVNTSNCGSSCTNECSSGQKRCNGSYSQTCGNYDSDSCYEWPSSTSGSGNIYCSYGCNSSNGQCYSALNVSISPTNPTVNSGVTQTFTASPSGGTGSYSYNWSLSSYTNCSTSSSTSNTYSVTCTNTGSSQTSRTVSVTVTSGSQSKNTSTTLYINPASSCNSSSYTTCSSALSMSNGQTQSNMCGSNQFYKITTTQTCDIKWTLTPNNADYDLYTKYSTSSCPSTSNWDCRPYSGGSSVETCTQTQLPAGTYYTMVNKYSGTGTYSIKAELSNCGTADSTMCSAKDWGPVSWTNPYIYYTNGNDFTGKFDNYDGYFKAYGDFSWDSTRLNRLKNILSAPESQLKFEFKRNQTQSNETWDGAWTSDCKGYYYSTFPLSYDNSGMEETDGQWRSTCAFQYDQICWATGNCNEEYQIVTKNISGLAANTSYQMYWGLAVDKLDGRQSTPWDASIELWTPLDPLNVQECYIKKGGNWNIVLLTTTSNASSVSSITIEQMQLPKETSTQNNIKILDYNLNFNSKESFSDFKAKKIKENKEILALTNKSSYAAQLTFKKPISKEKLVQMISSYGLQPGSFRFKATIGGGEAYYSLLLDEEAIKADVEQFLSTQSKDGIKNFKLIEGITALKSVIPRDKVLPLQNDATVAVLDMGPKETYLNENYKARITDVAYYEEMFGD